jgi:predicted glycogen debranching enzyme
MTIDDRTEWLEADGLGGFASGTASGVRTRRYHALLVTATAPPAGRVVLVNGFDAWVDSPDGSVALTTQRYKPGVLYPDGASRIHSFSGGPWPTWTFDAASGRIIQEIFVEHGTGRTVVVWTRASGSGPVTLRVRPFLSARDYHSLHHENGAFRFDVEEHDHTVAFRPYDGVPGVEFSRSGGSYRHAPDWYRQFLYTAESERGLDDAEDLASPGEFTWVLNDGDTAFWVVEAMHNGAVDVRAAADVTRLATSIRNNERARRSALGDTLARSADAYIVRRRTGKTIVAGYPWFTDWGRDTFIAIRGLCLATGRLEDAREILLEWADAVSDGMLPNRFPDQGQLPEYNAVDASLWYIVAVHEFLARGAHLTTPAQRATLEEAILRTVRGYAAGTRFGIKLDHDGLLMAGVPGVQLTWMDACVGDWVITPRIGKPVEVQALWLNALAVAARLEGRWRHTLELGLASFDRRFWIEERGFLADVVDVDGVAGSRDETFRPNQILAIGGLPLVVFDGPRARRVVDAIEATLWTPLGLRSLAPSERGYAERYEGGPAARDAVYHQGTVWPWLIGPFVESWIKVHGNAAATRREARERFLTPIRAHLETDGVAHVSEIADATPPFTPRGCPFQAWSLGELIRLDRVVLASPARKTRNVSFRSASKKPGDDRAQETGSHRRSDSVSGAAGTGGG